MEIFFSSFGYIPTSPAPNKPPESMMSEKQTASLRAPRPEARSAWDNVPERHINKRSNPEKQQLPPLTGNGVSPLPVITWRRYPAHIRVWRKLTPLSRLIAAAAFSFIATMAAAQACHGAELKPGGVAAALDIKCQIISAESWQRMQAEAAAAIEPAAGTSDLEAVTIDETTGTQTPVPENTVTHTDETGTVSYE